MTDIWSKEKRSEVMAKIRSKDTRPELIVRKYLYSRGYRYRKNVKGLPGTPDIVLLKYRTAIFVHGCFWHGHEADGHLPHSNKSFWERKIKRNKERDARVKEQLRDMGWKVMTIWECQLKPAVRQRTLLGVEYFLNKAYLERYEKREERQELDDKPAVAKTGIGEKYMPIEKNTDMPMAAEQETGYGRNEGKG